MILTEKQQNISFIVWKNRQVYLTGEEILPSNEKQIIEQAKFTYYPLRKAFKKTNKKQLDAITNQSKKLEALTNKDDDHKDKEIFKKLIKERFDK